MEPVIILMLPVIFVDYWRLEFGFDRLDLFPMADATYGFAVLRSVLALY
jgi:hypothetical protein